jgi:hypothetical protein
MPIRKITMKKIVHILCVALAVVASAPVSALQLQLSLNLSPLLQLQATVSSVLDPVLNAGCSWPLVSDQDLINLAFPDESATYWTAVLPYVPGTRLRIDGQFPQARYFSFNTYAPTLAAVDAVADYKIDPVVAGANPYRSLGAAAGGRYVVYAAPTAKPAQPAANTVYSGEFPLVLGLTVPLNPVILLIYRIYLPEVDGQGGVPLPTLTLQTADGRHSLVKLDMKACEPLPPEGLLPGLLNDFIREASLPAPVTELMATAPLPLTPSEPEFVRNYGVPEAVRQSLSNALGFELPGAALTVSANISLFPNVDNAYMTALLSRDKGSMYVARGKAPRQAESPAEAPLGGAQVRYWSICTNELVTQRFVACAPDQDLPLDRDGYFTVVVSDPAQRPANVIAANGMAWLPWGAIYPDSFMIYRHMLPSPHFSEAIQNIPYGTPAADVMSEYFPSVTYCDRATVESAGADPAAVFAACASP